MGQLFSGIFDSGMTETIQCSDFLLCVFSAFICGIILRLIYQLKSRSTPSFLLSLSILPIVVCVVIMMVNGNIGTGVAIAGAFGLVRFRSAPGTAKEIAAIFTAMCIGLIVGMGYIGYGLLFTIVISVIFLLYSSIDFGAEKKMMLEKVYRVTIPENLDYTSIFDDLFRKYTKSHRLIQVKTVNMEVCFV